jgi:hypothetical protein
MITYLQQPAACTCFVQTAILFFSTFSEVFSSGRSTLLVAQLVEALRYKPNDRGLNTC